MSQRLTTDDYSAASELRQWLKDQACRVGPIFEPSDKGFSLFVYLSRDHTVDLIGRHGGFRIEDD